MTVLVIATACATLAEVAAACTGDCDGNGAVTIDELVRGVSFALGDQAIETCARLDGDRNRRVSITELVQAVDAALTGCVTEITNVIVNDRAGQVCGQGCMQSETSIAVLGSNLVIGYNDSEGTVDRTQGFAGYSYSTDGGLTWTDGGGLPLNGPDDRFVGDPSVAACNGAVCYADLYSPPQCPSAGFVQEAEPNDSTAEANLVMAGNTYNGTIASDGDQDVVRFVAQRGAVIGAQLTPVNRDAPDASLELLSGDGRTSLVFGSQGAILYPITTAGTTTIRRDPSSSSPGWRSIRATGM